MRHLWLDATGLAKPPTGKLDPLQMIKDLGFVQLDTIQNVMRAHHHILWSRNQNYRDHMLDNLLAQRQHIFEHFTHDASVIPTEFYPMWRRQFSRKKTKMGVSGYYKSLLNETERNAIKTRIDTEGALSTAAFDTKVKGVKKMWDRPPHKIALDYMWYIGELSTSHRVSFRKYYDLTHKIIPAKILAKKLSDQQQINWLCESALQRLGIGNLKDIKSFWEAMTNAEVKQWLEGKKDNLIKVKWQTMDGQWLDGFALSDIEQRMANLSKPTSRLRIINPFDPAIRDRVRLKAIFGLDYKIEIFVPSAKRKWGYYVYPLLEGDRFVGRIELKALRNQDQLQVVNFWQETGIKWSQNRQHKLLVELKRLANCIGISQIIWL